MRKLMNGASTIVQMRFNERTMDTIEKLKTKFKTENRTRLFSASIALVELLKDEIDDGSVIKIIRKDGSEKTIGFDLDL